MNYKNIKIISEFAHNALIRSGISAKDYLNVLANAGFKVYKIIEEKDETTLRLINYSQFNEFIEYAQ